MKVLLVEDEESIAITLGDDLREAGHEVTALADGTLALRTLRDQAFDCVITDVRLPGVDGIEVLKAAKTARPDTEVLVMTAYATVEAAVEAMRCGADDYIQKPFLNEAVVERLRRIGEYRTLLDDNRKLREDLQGSRGLPGIIGDSRAMQDVFKVVRTVAGNDASVLITGESGTGKERIAQALHKLSPRSVKPFVALSCGALPDTLLETELFGHEKGAFTDAGRQRKGRFELANGGTMFLDDIDDMPLQVQVKLLRVIQEREFERVGGEETIQVDMRIVSATKVSLLELVKQGKFREDLYYRLNVVPINLPPLREREGDVPLLVQHFRRLLGGGRNFSIKTDVLEAMSKYTWPGNVRELENHVAQAIAMAGSSRVLRKEHLLPVDKTRRAALNPSTDLMPLREVLVDAERRHIEKVLKSVGGHRTKAAGVLGISRKVLWEKLKDYGID
ncbi:MAG: sigma-54-dependent Fis family transcriptional regulator [Planctomycetes bacterium]|nr:sigma-54-dependent Fis family transcriptional regulator [Planctomycetota bacterium]MCB9868693.1 sigma-54-dependent Fis family transcriptional regulator [Planctomycetota bacterium]